MAAAGGRRAASRGDPGYPGSLGRLAVKHAQQGRHDTAVRLLREAVDLDPGAAELRNNLGLVLHAMQRTEQAVASYRSALAIRPRYALALNNLGVALAALERHAEAVVAYQDALAIAPSYAEALCNLGTSLHVLGRGEEAAGRFREALTLRPCFVEAWINLGHLMAARGRCEEAIPCYEAALEAMPGKAGVHVNLARVLNEAGCHAKAIEHYRKAVAISPDLAAAHAGLGSVLLEIGRIDEARRCFERAASLEPECPMHLLGITRTTKLTPGSPHLGTLLALEKRIVPLGTEAKIDAHFAIAKALADIGEHHRSFAHLLDGNRLKRRSISYDEAIALHQMERIRAVFTPEFLRLRQGGPCASSLPVFIVGMPRSGSTLVEQVLASHPRVFGAGELDFFRQSLRAAGLHTQERKFPDSVPSWTEEELSAAASEYLRRLEGKARQSAGRLSVERITDKMLSNFRYLGLIHLMLPNARIIHTCRDPIDTCLSCFSIEFARLPFTFDLAELGRHYRAYEQLMGHWRATLPPDRTLEVRYEDMVNGFETTARRIVAHCGLDWNDACLRFYETDRPVHTASVAQVRQPLYRHAVGRWRPGAKTLRPLLDALTGF